jgi:hypothetical protein
MLNDEWLIDKDLYGIVCGLTSIGQTGRPCHVTFTDERQNAVPLRCKHGHLK